MLAPFFFFSNLMFSYSSEDLRKEYLISKIHAQKGILRKNLPPSRVVRPPYPQSQPRGHFNPTLPQIISVFAFLS